MILNATVSISFTNSGVLKLHAWIVVDLLFCTNLIFIEAREVVGEEEGYIEEET